MASSSSSSSLVVTLSEENESLRAESARLRGELASVVDEYGALEEDEARRGAEGAALAEAFVETSRVYFGAIRAQPLRLGAQLLVLLVQCHDERRDLLRLRRGRGDVSHIFRAVC